MHALEIWCMDVGVNTMTLINEHYDQNVKAETENEIMVSIDEKLLIMEWRVWRYESRYNLSPSAGLHSFSTPTILRSYIKVIIKIRWDFSNRWDFLTFMLTYALLYRSSSWQYNADDDSSKNFIMLFCYNKRKYSHRTSIVFYISILTKRKRKTLSFS